MHPITAVQMEWSLWSRDIEEEIIPLCRFIQFTDDVFIILVSLVLPLIRRLHMFICSRCGVKFRAACSLLIVSVNIS